MLTPEYLARINEATQEKVSEVNSYLIARIARQITATFERNGTVELIPTSLYNVKKLTNAGAVYEDVQAELESRLPSVRKEVKTAFYDATNKISEYNNAATIKILIQEQSNGNLQDIKVPTFQKVESPKNASDLNMTPKEIRMLESAYKRTNGEITNITRSSAIQAQKAFLNACDSAYFKATRGVSLSKAIAESIEELADKGITTVYYDNREDSIETAVARATRTGINQASGDITLTRCAETGASYVLVSQHLGARVTGTNDYRDHSLWQGEVYSLDWSKSELSSYMPTEKEIAENKEQFAYLDEIKKLADSKVKYKDFIETCGYGKIQGIAGINCRHSFGLFYPGININNNKSLDDAKNEELYTLQQKQRKMESEIRKTKRKLDALKQSGLEDTETKDRISALNIKLRNQNKKYRDFCEENKDKGIKPLNWRLKVAKTSGIGNI